MIAGIVGQTNLGNSETIDWLKSSLHKTISQYHVTEGYTCLAPGADQLFASVLVEEGLPFTTVIPGSNYQQTFTESSLRAAFFSYLIQTKDIVKLQHHGDPEEKPLRAAAKFIVKNSQIFVTIWDGEGSASTGTTEEIIRYAQLLGKMVVNINPTTREIELI